MEVIEINQNPKPDFIYNARGKWVSPEHLGFDPNDAMIMDKMIRSAGNTNIFGYGHIVFNHPYKDAYQPEDVIMKQDQRHVIHVGTFKFPNGRLCIMVVYEKSLQNAKLIATLFKPNIGDHQFEWRLPEAQCPPTYRILHPKQIEAVLAECIDQKVPEKPKDVPKVIPLGKGGDA